MRRIENTFEWCLKRAGDKKGLKKKKPDKEELHKHLEKAKHNISAMNHNIECGFSDWAVSAAFYAMYHALLAILQKLGYESRNQECTIVAVEYFIKKGKINLDQKYIEMIRRTNEMLPEDAKSMREEFQYGTETDVEDEILNEIKRNTIEFVEKVRIALEHIE